MSQLNSFSVTNDKYAILPELITVEESSRIFSEKGLFIIPYKFAPPVAFVEASCDVMDVSNESRSVWTNPELSFYGYAHTRRFKQPFLTFAVELKESSFLYLVSTRKYSNH